ncbi:hypothetical protein B0T14DRAFT_524148 [Immersiella caudata]|uniref:Uncharacterized protein n=1 Tax=Immersiella caudata TaxID=314043 RepID=A0AA39WKF0_9PEZI|nr:hypothetical protein B0T14DRAFT_524148 [Immersiella caudata]
MFDTAVSGRLGWVSMSLTTSACLESSLSTDSRAKFTVPLSSRNAPTRPWNTPDRFSPPILGLGSRWYQSPAAACPTSLSCPTQAPETPTSAPSPWDPPSTLSKTAQFTPLPSQARQTEKGPSWNAPIPAVRS